jgi:hypothetical protein
MPTTRLLTRRSAAWWPAVAARTAGPPQPTNPARGNHHRDQHPPAANGQLADGTYSNPALFVVYTVAPTWPGDELVVITAWLVVFDFGETTLTVPRATTTRVAGAAAAGPLATGGGLTMNDREWPVEDRLSRRAFGQRGVSLFPCALLHSATDGPGKPGARRRQTLLQVVAQLEQASQWPRYAPGWPHQRSLHRPDRGAPLSEFPRPAWRDGPSAWPAVRPSEPPPEASGPPARKLAFA